MSGKTDPDIRSLFRRARTDSSDGEDETGSNHGGGLDGGADRDAGGRGRSGRTDAVPDDPVAAAAMAEGRRGRRDSVSPHPRPDDEEQIYNPRYLTRSPLTHHSPQEKGVSKHLPRLI